MTDTLHSPAPVLKKHFYVAPVRERHSSLLHQYGRHTSLYCTNIETDVHLSAVCTMEDTLLSVAYDGWRLFSLVQWKRHSSISYILLSMVL
jgi:hypothetical protein